MVGLTGVDGVLRQGALAPGVGTAYAVNVEIDVQINEAATGNVIGMTRALKVFFMFDFQISDSRFQTSGCRSDCRCPADGCTPSHTR